MLAVSVLCLHVVQLLTCGIFSSLYSSIVALLRRIQGDGQGVCLAGRLAAGRLASCSFSSHVASQSEERSGEPFSGSGLVLRTAIGICSVFHRTAFDLSFCLCQVTPPWTVHSVLLRVSDC